MMPDLDPAPFHTSEPATTYTVIGVLVAALFAVAVIAMALYL